jgi:hypothetical protein
MMTFALFLMVACLRSILLEAVMQLRPDRDIQGGTPWRRRQLAQRTLPVREAGHKDEGRV